MTWYSILADFDGTRGHEVERFHCEDMNNGEKEMALWDYALRQGLKSLRGFAIVQTPRLRF